MGEEEEDGAWRNNLVCQAVVEITGLGAIPSVPSACTTVRVWLSPAPGDYPSPAHLSWVAARGSGSNTVWISQTPPEILFATERNLCFVLPKHMRSVEGSSWLWHPDLSKTSCVDLGLARLNGDGIVITKS